MAQVIWTEPALQDLEAIADYIALDDPTAARALVQRFFGTLNSSSSTRKAARVQRR